MNTKLIRLISILTLIIFLNHQVSYAFNSSFISVNPIQVTASQQSFSIEKLVKDSFGSFVNQLNPITGYQNLFKSVTDGVTRSISGFTKLISNVGEQLGIQIGLEKIDQSLEKTKLGAFTKAVFSTVANAGFEGLGSLVTKYVI